MDHYDFGDGRGMVPASRHPNGGGLVASTASVHPTAYVGVDCTVGGFASVQGTPRISNGVSIRDAAVVHGETRISGPVIIKDESKVGGTARVRGSVVISENARVYAYSNVSDSVVVRGNVHLCGSFTAHGNAQFDGKVIAFGKCTACGDAEVSGDFEISSAGMVTGRATRPPKYVTGLYEDCDITLCDDRIVFGEIDHPVSEWMANPLALLASLNIVPNRIERLAMMITQMAELHGCVEGETV